LLKNCTGLVFIDVSRGFWLQNAITFMSESIQRPPVATIRKALVLGLVLSLFLTSCLVVPAGAQDSPLPAVELSCGSDPMMDVHPTSDPEASVTCTVTNPTSASEEISITKIEWDGILVEMSLSEDTFTLGAGADDTFEIRFIGQTKIPATVQYSFEIQAKVESWNGLPLGQLPEGFVNVSTSHIGDLNIQSYGMVELLLTDVTTRIMETSSEVEFSFQVTNKGNAADKLEVVFANAAEFETAGFSFPAGTLVSENVGYQGTTSVKTLTIRAPSEMAEDLRLSLLIRAQSTNDESASFSEISIPIEVRSSSQSGSLGDLNLLSSDDPLQIVAIGGGVILALLFIVVLVRVVSKKGPKDKSQPKVLQPIVLPEEPIQDSEVDDLDDFFSDLDDENIVVDEFDDLLDGL